MDIEIILLTDYKTGFFFLQLHCDGWVQNWLSIYLFVYLIGSF